MPTYVGFSTRSVNQPRALIRVGVDNTPSNSSQPTKLGKKFKLTDEKLVIQDFINSFGIKQGDKVGQPSYGTTIWDYLFDPNTSELRASIVNEIRRVATLDPRLIINNIEVYNQDLGVLIELELAITPFNNATQVGFFLNRFDGSVQQASQ